MLEYGKYSFIVIDKYVNSSFTPRLNLKETRSNWRDKPLKYKL